MAPDVLRIKRIYDRPQPGDGYRVLIDRVWPRGVSKDRAQLDEWARELAPSDELRRWFDHRPERFAEFRRRYREELTAHAEQIDELRARAGDGPVTILYAARDQKHNNAVVVGELVRGDTPTLGDDQSGDRGVNTSPLDATTSTPMGDEAP